jgi:hypothetical protein
MRPMRWTPEELAVAGGIAVALAGSAEAAWSLYARFAVDFAGLSAVERAGAALWDFRPVGTALFLVGAVAALIGLRRMPSRLEAAGERVAGGVALLAAAHAALAAVILGASVWVAAAGRLGERDELAFVYSSGERAVTLVTQSAAWVPLAVVLGLVAVRALRGDDVAVDDAEAPESSAEVAAGRSLGDEMEELWRERLAFGPARERARVLLGRIRALEAAGDSESAAELADEMRALAGR